MLACKGIFVRTSIRQTVPSTVSGFAAKAYEGRLSALLYNDTKMLARKGIFVRTSIRQTVPSTVSGFAAKAYEGRLSAVIISYLLFFCKSFSAFQLPTASEILTAGAPTFFKIGIQKRNTKSKHQKIKKFITIQPTDKLVHNKQNQKSSGIKPF
jgi:hypothetical protein